MSNTKPIKDVTINQKKLEDLQLEIIRLQEQQKVIQEEISLNLSAFLIDIGALSIPQEALIGGILYIIDSYHNSTNQVGEWQTAGRRFLQTKKSAKGKKVPASTNIQASANKNHA